MRLTTEVRIDERGDETHESWVVISAHKVSGMGGGVRLFDSEIPHRNVVMVEIKRCKRRRNLNHDSLFETEKLFRLEMSQAQWGAFVSSFGGAGVPATLRWLTGYGVVPDAPVESRLEESVKDVRESGDRAFQAIQEDFGVVEALFEQGAGRKVLREAIRSLHYTIKHAPPNMEFAAKSLTEHVENVVTKARADIEAMAIQAAQRERLGMSDGPRELEEGSEDREEMVG